MTNLKLTLLLILIVIPGVVMAQSGFQTLAGIPGLEGGSSLADYVRVLFYLSISIAAMLAVVKLVIAGAKYMLSDVVTNKQSALADIRGAVFGLLLILATVVILISINRQIINTDITARMSTISQDFRAEGLQLPRLQSPQESLCESEEGCTVIECSIRFALGGCEDWCNEQEGGIFLRRTTFFGLSNFPRNACVVPGTESGSEVNPRNIGSAAIWNEFNDELLAAGIPESALIQNCSRGAGGMISCGSTSTQIEECNNRGRTNTRIVEFNRSVIIDEAVIPGGASAAGSQVNAVLACW